MELQPFTPAGNTVSLAVTSSNGRVALTQAPSGSAELTVILRNEGDAEVFIKFGDVTVVAAAATSMPIPAGSTMVFSVNALNTHVAAITASGTATIRATSGSGIPYGFGGSGAGGGAGASDVNIAEAGGVAVVAGTAPVPVGFYNPVGGALLDPTLPAEVVGSVASGATDSGKPVKVGAIYNSAAPTFTNGQRADLQVDSRGSLFSVPVGPNQAVLSSTSAIADGAANNPARLLEQSYDMEFNGATWDRTRNNNDGTAFASAARTATPTPFDGTNYNGRGLHLVIDCTAITSSPSVVFTIQGKDALSGKFYTILASAAIVGTGTTVLRVYPGLTVAANLVASDITPRSWRVIATHGNADSITYSVGYSLIL